jgi:hypothetical protein
MYMSMYIYGPGLGQQHLRKEGRPTAPMWGWVGGFGQGGGGGGGTQEHDRCFRILRKQYSVF